MLLIFNHSIITKKRLCFCFCLLGFPILKYLYWYHFWSGENLGNVPSVTTSVENSQFQRKNKKILQHYSYTIVYTIVIGTTKYYIWEILHLLLKYIYDVIIYDVIVILIPYYLLSQLLGSYIN